MTYPLALQLGYFCDKQLTIKGGKEGKESVAYGLTSSRTGDREGGHIGGEAASVASKVGAIVGATVELAPALTSFPS